LSFYNAERIKADHAKWLEESHAFDPKPGTKLSLPRKGVNGKSLKLGPVNELLFVGNCSDCILNQVDAYLKTRQGSTPLLIVAQLSKYGTLALGERLSTQGFQLASDPDGTLHRAYHAFYTPRWYVVSDKETLINIQVEQTLIPSGGCNGCPK